MLELGKGVGLGMAVGIGAGMKKIWLLTVWRIGSESGKIKIDAGTSRCTNLDKD